MGHRWKRQLLLFLLAILLPAAVLVTLAVRLVHQETELTAKRVDTARREAAEQLRRELSAKLDGIKLSVGSAGPAEPAIVFVARLEQDRMVLPWEDRTARHRLSPAFTTMVQEGESSEFQASDPINAALAYQTAVTLARTAPEKCEGRLRLGRVWFKQGKKKEAAETFTPMLRDCDSVFDQDGVAFALYAADRLIQDDLNPATAREYILKKADTVESLSLIQAYLIRSLVARVQTGDAVAGTKLSSKIHDMEEMATLARDLHAPLFRMDFTFGARPGDAAWLAYGDEPWLITILSPAPLASPMVLAVSSRQLAPPGSTLVAGHTSTSMRVGEGLVNLEVEWPEGRFASAGQAIPGALYGAGIALILSMTVLAGYLLLRDIVREGQIAQMRSLFVASVSHELKTPLTAIRMFAETLGKERPPDEKRRTDYARIIVNESERLSRLVDNLLDFSRIEYGEKIYRKKWISLADVVASAADAMQYPLSQKGFDLDIAIEDGLPTLLADPDAIQQAILNLLTNAMKYSGDSRSIQLKLKRSGGEVSIDVIDQGMGIDEVEQKRIFDRFYRVRSEPTDRITGAGLGLTLALHIANAHGGRLEVASAPGHGSTFSMRIPVVTA